MLPCWFVAFLFCCVSCCYMLLLCMWNVLVVYSMYSFWICEFKKVNKQRNREKFDAPYMGARGFPADLNSHYKQTTSKFICGMSSKGAGVVERCISYLYDDISQTASNGLTLRKKTYPVATYFKVTCHTTKTTSTSGEHKVAKVRAKFITS